MAGSPGVGAGPPVAGALNHPATSTTRSVAAWLYSPTVPDAPSGPRARFGIVWPAAETFRFDASGTGPPPGNTVTKPGPAAPVAVTFMSTAATPVAGSPARPAMGSDTGTPAARRGGGALMRGSSSRAGTTGVNSPSADGAALIPVTYPSRSATRSSGDWL